MDVNVYQIQKSIIMKERVKNFFKNYPKHNECFETSDGFIFTEKHRAQAHADTLGKTPKEKTIISYKRSDVPKEKETKKPEGTKAS